VASDAITLLRDDHKHIRRLFREFQATGGKAVKKKAKLAGQIIELLTVHTYIENRTYSNRSRSTMSPMSCARNCPPCRPMRSASTPRPRY
jgi:hypothetical protein